ncbi:MAG TPA: NHL repeat-containing protein [Nitrososphaerales archaeon]|nr:NHL repeat-containing protein [Nitrososphaerales archaeon]
MVTRVRARSAGFGSLLILLVAGLLLVSSLPLSRAFSNGTNASVVVGQGTFLSSYTSSNQGGMAHPSGAVFDTQGNLWVADSFDNRVLEYVPPFSNGMNASLVIGQASFTTVSSTVSASGLNFPTGLAFDSHGNLWVADTGDRRVLEFTPPFASGMSASLVVGQASFTSASAGTTASAFLSPQGIAFDQSGDLWVADGSNNRLLEFTQPFASGMSASAVIGQPNFNARTPETSQVGLDQPSDVYFDQSGNLWVADSGNNRLLEFTGPYSTGMAASLVIGQQDFTGYLAGTTQSQVSYPTGVAFDQSGNLWVADSRGARALEFTGPFADGMDASFVVGQPPGNFTSNSYSVTPSSFSPWAIAFDSHGDLWTTDYGSSRVLEFTPPYAGWMTAAVELGQSSFYNHYLPTSSGGLSSPHAAAFDQSGNLWVADSGDSRLTEFTAPLSTGINATLVVGAPNLWDSLPATSRAALWSPEGLAFDRAGDLWVADTQNNRILEFKSPLKSGMNASLVIGQFGFTTAALGSSQYGLIRPTEVAFDQSGDLWVTDSGNNRVLEYRAPYSTGMAASLVLGQGSFGTSSPEAGGGGMDQPTSLAFDSSGSLWVADSGNNRVLQFQAPFLTGMNASAVLGQTSFSSTSSGQGSNSMSRPTGVAADKSGNLWVGDTGNNRVLEFLYPFATGESASTVLGQPGFGLGAAGTGQASLASPSGLVADGSGDVWLADSGNNRVLEFTAPASSTTTTSSTSSTTTSSTSSSSTSSTTGTTSGTTTSSSSSGTTSSTSTSLSTSSTTSSGTSTSTGPTSTSRSTSTTQSSTATTPGSSTSSTTSSSQATSTGTQGQSSLTWLVVGVVIAVVVVIALVFLARRRRP